jgi:hypothetical protein
LIIRALHIALAVCHSGLVNRSGGGCSRTGQRLLESTIGIRFRPIRRLVRGRGRGSGFDERGERTLKDLICGFVSLIRIAEWLFDSGNSGVARFGQLA